MWRAKMLGTPRIEKVEVARETATQVVVLNDNGSERRENKEGTYWRYCTTFAGAVDYCEDYIATNIAVHHQRIAALLKQQAQVGVIAAAQGGQVAEPKATPRRRMRRSIFER